jgi:hypothetical protein
MLKLNPDQQRLPHGGHHYPIIDGPLVRADSAREVIRKITDYRIANALPLGDPEQELYRYYHKFWPYTVIEVDSTKGDEPATNFPSWAKWVRKAWKMPPKLVTTKEASFRWDICLTCPHNKQFDWKETNESAVLSQRAFLLRRGIEAPKALQYCDLHRADLSVLTFTETPGLFSEKPKEAIQPSCCWV